MFINYSHKPICEKFNKVNGRIWSILIEYIFKKL